MRKARRSAVAWGEVLQRFELSGMTVTEFCAAEGCSAASFYQWKRRLRQQAPVAFTELMVVPSASASHHSVIEIELPSCVRVKLQGPVDSRQLRTVLDCLEQRP